MFNSFTAAMAASAAAKVLQFYSSRSNDIFAKCRIPVTAKIKLLKRAAKNRLLFPSSWAPTRVQVTFGDAQTENKQTRERSETRTQTDRQSDRMNKRMKDSTSSSAACVLFSFKEVFLNPRRWQDTRREISASAQMEFFQSLLQPKNFKARLTWAPSLSWGK